jgi:hypothetical protein
MYVECQDERDFFDFYLSRIYFSANNHGVQQASEAKPSCKVHGLLFGSPSLNY